MTAMHMSAIWQEITSLLPCLSSYWLQAFEVL
eukprot:CAMPEP_0168618638 /NCGR_PEP_ID=MMETSP0449_2-20121227/6176_1 /TAXON_ID=1082188 /ORGANISM="Strombidium rassoulzadegani, Strain ras09" /LENGTH=31 /DNA_ID= /DNA_START= /DNA_END= /DNA_ORIENTATION=